MKYDLHIHTTCSDGKYSKLQLLNYFNKNNYELISFADHNYIELKPDFEINNLYYETYNSAQKVPIINAIEFDVDENSSLHILGYDIKDKAIIKSKMENVRKVNTEIVKIIINKIYNVYGIEIPVSDLLKKSVDGNITKSDITEWMIAHNFAKNYIEAGMLYTSKYSPCYEKRYSLPMLDVISLINKCGGLSFLAHPSSIKYTDDKLHDLLANLVDNGLCGIEINNLDKTTKDQILFYKKLACEFKLLQSCGSDFHNEKSTHQLGLDDNEISDFVKVLKRRGSL